MDSAQLLCLSSAAASSTSASGCNYFHAKCLFLTHFFHSFSPAFGRILTVFASLGRWQSSCSCFSWNANFLCRNNRGFCSQKMVGRLCHSQAANVLYVGLQQLGSHPKRLLLHLKSRQMLTKASSFSSLSVGGKVFTLLSMMGKVSPRRAQELGGLWRCHEVLGLRAALAQHSCLPSLATGSLCPKTAGENCSLPWVCKNELPGGHRLVPEGWRVGSAQAEPGVKWGHLLNQT